MFYAEVRTKDGFFYNFAENIISCYTVTRDAFKVFKLHSPAARAIFRNSKTSLLPIYHEMDSCSYDFRMLNAIHQGKKCDQRRKEALSRKSYNPFLSKRFPIDE